MTYGGGDDDDDDDYRRNAAECVETTAIGSCELRSSHRAL
jgi:hypothetical protein